MRIGWHWLIVVGCLAVASPAGAQSDDLAAFWGGKTVTFVAGASPGGSYDVGARLIARHLGRHIPGKPGVIVQNMPGAGSMAAANHLYNVSARDGSVIGIFGRGLYLDALFGASAVRFDPRRFGWIGSHAREVATLVTGPGTPFKTLADAQANEMVVSTSPVGSDSYSFGVVLNALVGTRLKLVTGYPGMAEQIMAIDRGEVQGNPGASTGTLLALRPAWLKEPGKANFLVQLASEPHPVFLKGVPLALDHARNPTDRQALSLIVSRMTIAYAFTAPPELPPARLAALRGAFDGMVKDPEFLADAARMNADVHAVSGGAIADIVARAYASPPEVVARAKAAMAQP